jgi:23S rRNA pseudouridine955/2504/2580 synthase
MAAGDEARAGPGGVALEVAADEDGMKLLRFLERRLEDKAGKAALHKWIRTGQVRVNGGRAAPFSRLVRRDRVRLPPFARVRPVAAGGAAGPSFPAAGACPDAVPAPGPDLGPDVRIVARTPQLLVLEKPAGLPCQPGSGRQDSLCARLAAAFAGAAFIPAPAHRLDRHSSGLVAVGLSHAAQRRLHDLFAAGGIRKEYLAWVRGDWRPGAPCLLRDRLRKCAVAGREAVRALPESAVLPLPEQGGSAAVRACPPPSPEGDAASSGIALSAVLAVSAIRADAAGLFPPDAPDGGARASLLLLRLVTGRTHQLRVQLSSRGFPIIGDGRYGGPRFFPMLLHAYALTLPDDFSGGGPAGPWEICAPPAWPAPFSPEAGLLAGARRRLARAVE